MKQRSFGRFVRKRSRSLEIAGEIAIKLLYPLVALPKRIATPRLRAWLTIPMSSIPSSRFLTTWSTRLSFRNLARRVSRTSFRELASASLSQHTEMFVFVLFLLRLKRWDIFFFLLYLFLWIKLVFYLDQPPHHFIINLPPLIQYLKAFNIEKALGLGKKLNENYSIFT